MNHVRGLLESGELGEVYSIDSQRLNLGRVRRDVDAIWNFAPHDISILNYWLGQHPRAVHCHAYDYLQPGIPDLAFLVLEYEHTVAHVHISWLHPTKVRRMTVVGSKKMVVYDDVEGQIVVHDAGIDRERVDRTFPDFETFGEFRLIHRVGDMHIPRIPMAEPLALQCRHFVDCITSGSEPVTGFEDAARVVEVLEAASASHANGGARVPIARLTMTAAMNAIPLVDLKAQYRAIGPEIEAAVARVLERQSFINAAETRAFEEEFAAFCEAPEAIGVSNGTTAIELILNALGVGAGDEVITVSHTFMATVGAILRTGATPVMVDVDEATWTMSPEQVARAVTPKTRAILPVHLYGNPGRRARDRGGRAGHPDRRGRRPGARGALPRPGRRQRLRRRLLQLLSRKDARRLRRRRRRHDRRP